MPELTARFTLTSPIESVPGIGPRNGAALRALGIPSVAHLIYTLPFRHEREEAETAIADIAPRHNIAARGEITATRVAGHGQKARFEAVMMDATGRLDLVWFNQRFLYKQVHPGMRLIVQGEARRRGPLIQLANPTWRAIDEESSEPARRAARLKPVYSGSERAPTGMIERAIGAILDEALPLIVDHFSVAYCLERDLPSLAEAYRMMHRPRNEAEIARAGRRLAYDELFFLQLAILKQRFERELLHAPLLAWSPRIDARIRVRFPFELTPGQNEAVAQIAADLQRARPAHRLIQGDVGSGKTLVALYAMLQAVAAGAQAALMAPTELLAEQHFASIGAILVQSRVRLELLTASLSQSERDSLHERIASGEVDLVIGTHALLTESVRFANLGVVVIDEQHRFGVQQRAALHCKTPDQTPHTLVMTATPIPRSLMQSFFGDLDVTTIRGMPPGRGAIETVVRTPAERAIIDAALVERIARGEQAYIVVPAIDSSDRLLDTTTVLARLEQGPLAGRRLAAIHGRLNRSARQVIMDRFRRGEIDALIATTVIEVGVDVPGATLMIIEHAERFGLAQLHQLRGRIGRGARDSLCIVVAEPKTPDAIARIEALASTDDGFELAEKDLMIRGPGDLAGVRQAGAPAMRIADIVRDVRLLALARRDARDWLLRSPRLDKPDEQLLRKRFAKAFRDANE